MTMAGAKLCRGLQQANELGIYDMSGNVYVNGAATGYDSMAAVADQPTGAAPVISVFCGVVVGPTLRGAAE